MNKLQKIILIAGFAILAISLLPAFSVFAVVPPPADNLTVDFEDTPLFTEANFLPGEAVTRYVDVTNNTSETKIIGVEATDYTSCSVNCLADQLKLKITDGTNNLYGEVSLTEFFSAGQKKLSNLGAADTIRYYFTVTFVPGAGNDYQEQQVSFDFDIGMFGQETIGGGGTTGGGGETGGGGSSGGSSSGGGGSFGGETELVIFNEKAAPVVSDQTDITWETNHPATSRVIYSSETEAHVFQLDNPPNYGYAHSTVEDSTPVINHSMNISGLVPGMTYYYRVVSHGSFAISTEHNFTVPLVMGEQTAVEGGVEGGAGGALVLNQGGGTGGGEITENTGGANDEGQNTGGQNTGGNGATQETQTGENSVNPFLASLLDLFKGGASLCLILFILVIIITILLLLNLFDKRNEETIKRTRWILSLAVIIILIILYSFICPDYYKLLLIIEAVLFVIFLAIYFYFRNKEKNKPSVTK